MVHVNQIQNNLNLKIGLPPVLKAGSSPLLVCKFSVLVTWNVIDTPSTLPVKKSIKCILSTKKNLFKYIAQNSKKNNRIFFDKKSTFSLCKNE